MKGMEMLSSLILCSSSFAFRHGVSHFGLVLWSWRSTEYGFQGFSTTLMHSWSLFLKVS